MYMMIVFRMIMVCIYGEVESESVCGGGGLALLEGDIKFTISKTVQFHWGQTIWDLKFFKI